MTNLDDKFQIIKGYLFHLVKPRGVKLISLFWVNLIEKYIFLGIRIAKHLPPSLTPITHLLPTHVLSYFIPLVQGIELVFSLFPLSLLSECSFRGRAN
jgi:hypothetical protein